MKTFAELEQERFAELASDPSYTAARQRWGTVGAMLGATTTTGLTIVATGESQAGMALAALALAVGAVLGFFIGRLLKKLLVKGEARLWAQNRFMDLWCAERGLSWTESAPAHTDVPMLRKGEKRDTGIGIDGQLLSELDGTIYNYTYYTEETQTRTDSEGNQHTDTRWVPHPHTVLRLEADLPLQALAVHPRLVGFSKMFDGIEDALSTMRSVQLESMEFNERYQVSIHDDDDNLPLLTLFDPTLIMTYVDAGGKLPPMETAGRQMFFMWPGHFTCADHDGLDEIDRMLEQVRPIVELLQRNARAARAA